MDGHSAAPMHRLDTTVNIKAKGLLLNLLRTSPDHRWPVRLLIEVGLLFGISENSIRVTLSRLRSDELIEQDVRGHYRLNWDDDPVRDWINNWSKGEGRTVDWDHKWLGVTPRKNLPIKSVRRLDKACYRLGFRTFCDGLWVRPNNLELTIPEINGLLEAMTGNIDLVISLSDEVYAVGEPQDLSSLWNRQQLEKVYQDGVEQLSAWTKYLDAADEPVRLRDSFILGGEAIRRLALDPLLPAGMIDIGLRAAYTIKAKEFVTKYNKVWQAQFGSDTIDNIISGS